MKVRDKETFILFIIGFGLTLFIILNGYHLINSWYEQYEKNVNSYRYSKFSFAEGKYVGTEGTFTTEEYQELLNEIADGALPLIQLLSDREVTTYMNFCLDVNGYSDGVMADVVFSYAEEWCEELKSGRYPSDDDLGQGRYVALAGESILDNAVLIDDSYYIEVEGDMYEIIGILENYEFTDEDESLVIFYPHTENNGILQELQEALGYRTFTLSMGSNEHEVDGDYEQLLKDIEGTDIINIVAEDVYKYTDSYSMNEIYYNIKRYIILATYGVSLINCFFIAGLWAKKRKKDFVIMKTFGLNNDKILCKAFGEICSYVGGAFIFAVILDAVYLFCFKTNISFDLNWYSLRIIIIAVLVMIICALIPVNKMINQIVPAAELKEL